MEAHFDLCTIDRSRSQIIQSDFCGGGKDQALLSAIKVFRPILIHSVVLQNIVDQIGLIVYGRRFPLHSRSVLVHLRLTNLDKKLISFYIIKEAIHYTRV